MSDQRTPSPAPAAAFVDTPEFRAAVAQATATFLAAQAPAPSGNQAFAEALAMAIAGLTDQGSGKKHVSPEKLRHMAEAHDRMMLLIDAAAAAAHDGDRSQVPEYELASMVYIGNEKIQPLQRDEVTKKIGPTVIYWQGVPSQAMKPANDIAHRIFAAFLDWIDAPAAKPAPKVHLTPAGVAIQGRDDPEFLGVPAVPKSHIIRKGDRAEYKLQNVLGTIAAPAVQMG